MSTTHAPTRRFSNIVNAGEADSRRWLVLATICFAALMIVLDVTVMNLALPSAQRALGFTNADRQWIVTAYSLSFGSLLLFGGRLADLTGRKVTFLAGSGLGLLIGGALTSYASWRWCMYINLVFAAIAITGGTLLLGRQPRTPGARLDVPGVAAVSGGMFCLVYGFSNAATDSWHALSTWSFLAAGAVLLIVFAAWQTRAAQPLLPPRVILDRNRGGAYLTMLIFGSALFGIFLFLVYYMQLSLGYSAVISGVALLPMVAVIGVMANVGNIVLMPRFGPKPLVILGLLCNAAGMAWLTRIGVHSGYASALLGPLVVTGFGSGLIFSAAANTGTFGVAPRDAGIASASVNTGQQLGGAIGTALLNTIAASATTSYLAGHLHGRPSPLLVHFALIHSYTTVFWWCAGIFAAGAVICGVLLRRGPLTRPQDGPAREPAREAAREAVAARP